MEAVMRTQPDLSNVVALVTGGTRGVGLGCVTGLAEYGARVHATGRSAEPGTTGRVTRHRVDHANDAETEAVVAAVIAAEGRLDILVNCAWPGYENMVTDGRFSWTDPIWDQPMWRWDAMVNVGVRAAYCAARPAARQMRAQRRGLIVNISFWAAQKFMQNTAYGIAKAATDKLSADLAVELAPYDVTAVSLYPGLVRTEAVLANAAFFDLANSESPQFQGRAIAHLYADGNASATSGQVLVSAQLGENYGFADIDGKRPVPLTVETA
jgi:NAD(P)-dependent dehydrogenase (short-subunit alcohol dehydrogenase family)